MPFLEDSGLQHQTTATKGEGQRLNSGHPTVLASYPVRHPLCWAMEGTRKEVYGMGKGSSWSPHLPPSLIQSLATFPLDLWEAHLGQCFPLLCLCPLVAVLAERREQLLWGAL